MEYYSPQKLFREITSIIYIHLKNLKESESISKLLLDNYLNCDISKIIIDEPSKIDSIKLSELYNAIERIKKNEPIQYIIGKANFFGRDYLVNKNVLIPRPETEEFVNDIIKEASFKDNYSPKVISKKKLRILDIGTGSGCIAISLFKEIPDTEVFALDISKDSLKVANENAKTLNAKISFLNSNILSGSVDIKDLDIIVSNPPYIKESEKKYMDNNVLGYEPHIALFVKDNDPFCFHKRIIEISSKILNKNGKLYLEINEAFGQEIKLLFTKSKFREVKICRDICGKDRWVKGIKY